MRLLITHLGETSPLELDDGLHVLGGGPADGIFLEPLPPALLRLSVEAAHLSLVAAEAVRIDGVPFPAGEPRGLVPGEVLSLPGGVSLQLEAPRDGSTAQAPTRAVFWQMLEEAHQPPSPGLAHLVCVAGRDRGRVFPLGRRALELGRSAEVDIRLRDRSVSRSHARLVRARGRWILEDLGAPNGVWLGGQRIRGRVDVHDGAVLELGRTVLRLQAPDAPRPPPPPPAPVAVPRRLGERSLIASCVILAVLGSLVGMAVLP